METIKDFDEAVSEAIQNEYLSNLMNMTFEATIKDGVYDGCVLKEVQVKNTMRKETKKETVAGIVTTIEKEVPSKVFTLVWKTPDDKTIKDTRFLREGETEAEQLIAIQVALSNIASQLNLPKISFNELIENKTPVTLWVSRYQGKDRSQRNVDYLEPFVRAPKAVTVPTGSTVVPF